MPLPLQSDRIQQLVAQQGWTDETLLGLLCDFIDEHQLVSDLSAYLLARATPTESQRRRELDVDTTDAMLRFAEYQRQGGRICPTRDQNSNV